MSGPTRDAVLVLRVWWEEHDGAVRARLLTAPRDPVDVGEEAELATWTTCVGSPALLDAVRRWVSEVSTAAASRSRGGDSAVTADRDPGSGPDPRVTT